MFRCHIVEGDYTLVVHFNFSFNRQFSIVKRSFSRTAKGTGGHFSSYVDLLIHHTVSGYITTQIFETIYSWKLDIVYLKNYLSTNTHCFSLRCVDL